MIFKLIFKPKYRKLQKAFALIILLAFTSALYSCQTVTIENYTADEFEAIAEAGNNNILEIKSKDSVINVSDTYVLYKKNQNDSSGCLMFEQIDTVKNNGPIDYKLRKSVQEICLKDIYNIKVEKSYIDFGKTMKYAGMTVGAILIVAIILLIIFPPDIKIAPHISFS